MLVAPAAQLWIDLWLPRSDARWQDDVVAGVRWVGEAWTVALARAGLHGLEVYGGSSQGDEVAKSVCFAGLGPGEVVLRDPPRKVMGLSQHRSRDGARIQMLAVRSWDPRPIVCGLSRIGLIDPAHSARFVDAARPRAVGLAELGIWPAAHEQPECMEAVVHHLAIG